MIDIYDPEAEVGFRFKDRSALQEVQIISGKESEEL